MNGKVCDEKNLPEINSCEILKSYFPCEECKESLGPEQPVYVDPSAPRDAHPSYCLYNMDTQTTPILCSSRHPFTQRLCLCK
jgi:hypothetical protein